MCYMRYLMLLICLAGGTVAHGYNEVISAVAYNPSLLGGYDYLKILSKATFKGGLGVADNKAEINFGGKVTINDMHDDQHKYTVASEAGHSVHRIKTVQSLSNYVLPGTSLTFCNEDTNTSKRWKQNPNACGTASDNHFNAEDAWLMGNQPGFWGTFDGVDVNSTGNFSQGNSAVTQYVPLVKTYGGNLTASPASANIKRGYSVIKQIQGIWFSGGTEQTPYTYTSAAASSANLMPVRITANELKGPAASSKLYADSIILGDAVLDVNKMLCPSGKTPAYSWASRKDDGGTTIQVLQRTCN